MIWQAKSFISLALAFTVTATGQHTPEDILKSFKLADPKLRVELVASEPLVESPCAMAFARSEDSA